MRKDTGVGMDLTLVRTLPFLVVSPVLQPSPFMLAMLIKA